MKSIEQLGNMSNRTALVTGGAGYLGYAICETLAESGVRVIIVDNNISAGKDCLKKLNSKFGNHHLLISCDLANKESINKAVDFARLHFESLDILINCASLVGTSDIKGWTTKFDLQEYSTFEKALSINLTSVFYLIQQCQDLLEKSNNPSIINIGSIYGFSGQKLSMYEDSNYLTPAAYSASKGGVIQLTKYLASILSPQIRVNCISPGGIENNHDKEFINRYKSFTPLNRMAQREDLKGAIHFFSSDLSSYITGQNLIVDGGWSL